MGSILDSRVVCLAGGMALFSAFSIGLASEPTGKELIQAVQKALEPPVRYRVVSNGSSMVLRQKVLSNGELATRIDMAVPLEKVTLVLGEESYELYPTEGVAIDTTFMQLAAKSQVASLSKALSGQSQSAPQITGVAMREGRKCYEVLTKVSREIMDVLAKSLSAVDQKQIPKESRVWIDVATLEPVEMETLSMAGTRQSQVSFTDFEHQASLPDDLFLPPDGLEMLKPQSVAEYVRAISKMIAAQHKRQAVNPTAERPRALPARPSIQMGKVQIDPQTGKAIAPVPPGVARDKFDAMVAKEREKIVAARRSQASSRAIGTSRKIGICVSLMMAVLFFVAVVRRRLRAARERNERRRPRRSEGRGVQAYGR